MQPRPINNGLLTHSKMLNTRFQESSLIIYNSGFTCTVARGRDCLTGNEVAIKLVQKKKLVSDAEIERARCELKHHSKLRNVNIVPLIACEETQDGFLTVTPYASDGDLHELTHCTTLTEEAARNCISQIAAAITYMHDEERLVHGDIKPHNMLLRKINGKYMIQLCDFGFTEDLRPATNDVLFTQLRGTSGYFAPEQLLGRSYDGKVDVFAMGVIAFTLIGGYEPFYPPDNMVEAVEFEPRYWRDISDEAKDFLTRCLSIDPQQRMTAKEALNHPWITMNIPSAPARGDSLDETMTPPPDSSIEFWNVKDIIKKDSEASIAETMAGGRVLKNEGFVPTINHRTVLLTCGDGAAGPRNGS
ncbi:Calcium-dependent protein kinase, putative [Perkinsus marinus ATCC 50983]|uniref:Calcium-dependent protein kinase, putative n=1 Tax=Perkinsus marinus (strain ATCC 50983 / TXsc) TaxID=423536 RepID=C5K6C2_PERM5|nr:Calcium-dependent protein kinase, putative [Perkinsus marinus ATCC 50983]EER19842.1 Calcium-dependent protein kinase, putative [Perkinsus marinus ATCC 50983]|eukprot:XP_002788046.1 Calcium-dependent protein kinase, putative [Perkinsus marinus ATCC 50983]